MRKSIFASILVTFAASYACQAQTNTKAAVLSEKGSSTVETTTHKTELVKGEPQLSIHGKAKNEANSVNSKAARKPQLSTSEAVIKEDN